MARTVLVEADTRGGEALVAALREQEAFGLEAAFWLNDPAYEEWRLIVAARIVETQGQLAAYKMIGSALANLPTARLGVFDVVAVAPDDYRVQDLRRSIHRKIDSDGVLIHDAYVYLL